MWNWIYATPLFGCRRPTVSYKRFTSSVDMARSIVFLVNLSIGRLEICLLVIYLLGTCISKLTVCLHDVLLSPVWIRFVESCSHLSRSLKFTSQSMVAHVKMPLLAQHADTSVITGGHICIMWLNTHQMVGKSTSVRYACTCHVYLCVMFACVCHVCLCHFKLIGGVGGTRAETQTQG